MLRKRWLALIAVGAVVSVLAAPSLALDEEGDPPAPSDSAVVPAATDTLPVVPAPSDSAVASAATDTLPVAPAPSDSAVVPAATDTLPVVPAPADTLEPGAPPDSLEAAPRDTLAMPGLRLRGQPGSAETAEAAPETVDATPTGVGMRRPVTAPAFARPWNVREDRSRSGLRLAALRVPNAEVERLPFERVVLADYEAGTIRIESRAGENLSRVSYAAPLAEYRRESGRAAVESRWRSMVLDDLGDEQSGARRGILDIDIPMPLPGPFARALGSGANLKVRGSERITFGGQTSYIVDALDTEAGPASRWPQLDMEQQLTVNLEGTIGRKIHVYVDHRSGGDAFGAGQNNQVRVHYDGDEDEIIQKIELGEVNLSLPGTEFVSYSGRHEGLFGAKMTAKVGKLDLVSVASKEEGKSAGSSFTGTSESDSLVIRDIDYEARRFYAPDSLVLQYRDVSFDEIHFYLDDRNGANDVSTGAQEGYAYLAAPNGASEPEGPKQFGMFAELKVDEDYRLLTTPENRQSGIIRFERPIDVGSVLAAWYVTTDGRNVGGADGDTLRLKMLKRDDRVNGTEWEPIRRYELKNFYDLGADQIPQEGFELSIRKRTPSGEILDNREGVPYIRIFGLDTYGPTDETAPDGFVDFDWIDFGSGYMWFPHYTPFYPEDPSTQFYYPGGQQPDTIYYANELPDDELNPAVYSEESFDAGDDLYFLEVKYDRPRTTFYLGHINIIENSEVVRLNGVRLTRDVDYTIYYPAGQLTLLAQEAKEPDARVTVDYDYKPFGVGGEKTLLGTRGVYNWSDNVKLGTTWMYQSKGTPEDRPRLGEEPSRTVVGDVNLSARFRPAAMTTFADAVPFVDTDAESSLRLSGEAAICIPNPNTKGFVAVDDMEGVDNVSILGVARRQWVPGSVPVDTLGFEAVVDSLRARLAWYNPENKVQEGELYPGLDDEEADDIRTVLELDWETDPLAGPDAWAGLMRLLSKTGNDYSEYQFVEFWMNDGGAVDPGIFHIDLGTISEDFYPLLRPNGGRLPDTEDQNSDGVLDARDEDTGLDNCKGGSGCEDDPDDDYSYSYGSPDFSGINGTEGNERLDTEDLNGNFYLDTENDYWSFAVDLVDDEYVVQDNANGWKLYRVPLDAARAVGDISDWNSIRSARIWFESLPEGEIGVSNDPTNLVYMIASLDVVGSQWQVDPLRYTDGGPIPEAEQLPGEGLKVDAKNTKEDPDYLSDKPFDPGTDEQTNLPKREQSLALLFDQIAGGHEAAARRTFFSDQNYTGYAALEFYVHADAEVDSGTVVFLRMGADTLNYYEYSLEIRYDEARNSGWYQRRDSDEKLLTVPFAALTALKTGELAMQDTAWAWGDTASVRRERFARVGSPSLSRVRRLTLGVRNVNDSGEPISGEVWVNDILLTDVRKEIGWARRATVEADFADLMEIDFDIREVDGDFHTLKQTTGSGQDNVRYNFSGLLNADRFVSGLGIASPVNVSWQKSVSRPRFSAGSDIVLSEDDSEKEKTETLDRSISVSLSRRRRSPDFLTHLIFDGLSLRASMAESERSSPTKADTTRTIRGRVSYKFSPERQGLRLFRNTQFFLKPTSIRFTVDTNLTHTLNYDISADDVKTKRTDAHDKKIVADGSIDFQFLDNLKTAHSVGVRRDLSQIYRSWADINIGTETQRRYSNSLTFSPKFGTWLTPRYSFSSSFIDNHGPEVRRAGDPAGVRNVTGQSNQQVGASLDIKRLFGPAAVKPRGGVRRPPRGEEEAEERSEEEGGGLGSVVDPLLAIVRSMDALDANYSLRRTSRFDRILRDELPDWEYQLGLSRGLGADDRTEEHVLTLGSGFKVTNQVRIKGDYKRTTNLRAYQTVISDTATSTTETRSVSELSKGSFSWSGMEKIGLFRELFKSVRTRSGVEYRRSQGGPEGAPTSKSRGLSLNPIVSLDATLKNGLTGSFSWDRKRSRSYDLTGAGSVTEDVNGSTSLTLNYRFSAPQGLKLPFFGQKLRFQSNLDCSLTFRTSSKRSTVSQTESGLGSADPTSSTRDFSVIGDATYSFSRSVSGGLRISFSQSKDEKRDQIRRTIGVHLTAEFKF